MPVKELLDKIDHGFTWMFYGREPDKPVPRRKARNFKILSVLALIALVLQTSMFFLALFAPPLPYRISEAPAEELQSAHFVQTLEALTQSPERDAGKTEVFTNGENFYEAQLTAIRQAKKSINLEAYIIAKGEITTRLADALAERARAGVQVNLLIDAIGAMRLSKDSFAEMIKAKGDLQWYNPIRFTSWPRINNRTHRELLIVDGAVGFIGGAGWADHWYKGDKDNPRWRDTMVRVEGDGAAGLQSAFAENWLESSGEILTGWEYFPYVKPAIRTPALVVASAPTTGLSTKARVLFQTLLASATKSIYITTPYFLPDKSARNELIRAVKERKVDVKIVVPGHKIDHAMTRSSSRRLYGDVLEAGAKIYEYQPAMIHAKILIIDGVWSVVGSTNFDSRSFAINDEVNLAVLDPALAARLNEDFQRDVSESKQITFEQWKRRPHFERANEWFFSLLERQQ
ncbi:MAG TPA: phospholipase D-like domain-containing protein [Bryobacteraceae bacterium]|nr:phospholipase D-like domain-containing protein [Bryobacteraceae bacterium]